MKEIQHWTDPTQGEVKIGTTEPTSGIVSEIISQLARKHPRITYRVSVSDTDTLGRELRERTLDVLLTGWVTRSLPTIWQPRSCIVRRSP